MQTRAARLARGWVLGAFATATAAVSHQLGGGEAPSLLALGAGLVFGGLLGTLVAGRRPSLPRVMLGVAGAQLAFHLLFSLLGTGATVQRLGHHGAAVVTGAPHLHDAAGPAMWIGHTIAAVVTIVVVAWAERALWGMLRETLRAIAAVTLAAVTLAPRPRRIPAPLLRVEVPTRVRLLADALSRRGPPLLPSL